MASLSLHQKAPRDGAKDLRRSRGDVSVASGVTDVSMSLDDDEDDAADQRRRRGVNGMTFSIGP